MTLVPIPNPDHPPTGDLLTALLWLETRCRIRGITEVTEEQVRAFLTEEEKRPDLAAKFVRAHLCERPDEPL